jgi:ankyrin repeat protein
MLVFAVFVALLLTQPPARTSARPNADLLESAKLGQLARVRELIAAGAAVDPIDRRGFTPLMWAAAGGQAEMVRLLLESGAAADRRASDGSSALMLAAANGFTEIVRALIVRGANVAATRSGVTAQQIAAARGHAATAALLAQAEGLGVRLIQAANEGHDAAVRQLLVLGAPANVTDARGVTALMMAARNGDLGIVQFLLSRGADPLLRDAQGLGVFEWAERSPETGKHVVVFLFDRGISRAAARGGAPAPSPQVAATLRSLETTLARVPPASDAIRQGQRRANSALAQLRTLSNNWPAESPEDYRVNLATDLNALEAALRAGAPESLAATVQALAEDLEIKLEHCTRSGGKLGGAVTVRVRTLHGSEEIKSWQVFYMPKVLEAAENASPDLFPQLSSPTEEALVPGRYVMWVRDPSTSKVGERTVVKVGEGKKELILELPVPADTRR